MDLARKTWLHPSRHTEACGTDLGAEHHRNRFECFFVTIQRSVISENFQDGARHLPSSPSVQVKNGVWRVQLQRLDEAADCFLLLSARNQTESQRGRETIRRTLLGISQVPILSKSERANGN